MPTSFASGAISSRIDVASATSVASASGSACVCGGFIKIGLEDDLRGDPVAHGPALSHAHASFEQRGPGSLGGETLVEKRHRNAEPAFELAGEALRSRARLVRSAIGMQRQSNDEPGRLPFVDERPDRIEVDVTRLKVNCSQVNDL